MYPGVGGMEDSVAVSPGPVLCLLLSVMWKNE